MSLTLTEKVLARASGKDSVCPGDEIWASADRMIMNDSSGPRRFEALVEELGGVRFPERVVVVSDHFTPAANVRHAAILKTTRDWSRRKGVLGFFEYAGVLHNIVLAEWLVRPGMLLVGADSHTVSAGAAGAVAVAVGSTELATVLATGEIWLRVPETARIELVGQLAPMVDMRDVTMRLLGDLGTEYATYRALEFGGSFCDGLRVEERLVLANQGIELGAKNAVVEPSRGLFDAMSAAGLSCEEAPVVSDANATFVDRRHYDVSTVTPLVAAHPSPDNVHGVDDVAGTAIDMAWMGSCVGGRYEDLKAAASVLRGRRVRAPFLVTPNTMGVYRAAMADGTLSALIDAGAVIQAPGCGACAGVHGGVQGDGDVVMATATRNFKGRMGSVDARVFIGSPYTVAASALAGRIIDPREVGFGGAS